MSLRWVLVAVVVAPALACRMGSRQETPPETTHRTESVYAEMEVSALRWSDGDWPFTVDSGILSCEGSRARPYLFFATLDRETIWCFGPDAVRGGHGDLPSRRMLLDDPADTAAMSTTRPWARSFTCFSSTFGGR